MKKILSQLKTPPSFKKAFGVFAAAAFAFAAPAVAQVESFDPDAAFTGAIDADLAEGVNDTVSNAGAAVSQTADNAQGAANDVANRASDPFEEAMATYQDAPNVAGEAAGGIDNVDPQAVESSAVNSGTYGEDDLIGAAEGVFGKGAEGVAKMIQGLLKDQGEPNAYIVGREAGGAFIVGARYGSGMLHHKIEGERKVYWTGPSIGLDAGANAGNTFVLVYNLFDTEDVYKRFPAGEGQAYLVGGLHASYVRRGDIVMIPVRVGAGLRLGVNAGYMKFSKKQKWLPF